MAMARSCATLLRNWHQSRDGADAAQVVTEGVSEPQGAIWQQRGDLQYHTSPFIVGRVSSVKRVGRLVTYELEVARLILPIAEVGEARHQLLLRYDEHLPRAVVGQLA
jgi:hypothetical protein